jgi:hypothetical protein
VTFVQWDEFTSDWGRLKQDDDDLRALEVSIMVAPKRPPVIAGTNGLRKIRFARRDGNRGKSGGLRVCYVYFEEYRVVLLLAAYGKNERDDISQAGKRAIGMLIGEINDYLGGMRHE